MTGFPISADNVLYVLILKEVVFQARRLEISTKEMLIRS